MTRKPRVPPCGGYRTDTTDGSEYGCAYGGEVDCEDCAAAFLRHGGTISPISGKPMPSLEAYKQTYEFLKGDK